MNENFDRLCLLIESVFRQAHQDATKGDRDATAFLASYGLTPRPVGHKAIAFSRRSQPIDANQLSGASAKV